jgi:indolepyruvate ferredoxin oxidoreductase
VGRIAAAEAARLGDSTTLTAAVATYLYKLMAYKDEYEVARLHLDGVERARLSAEFGPDATATVLLHPPVLRALGMNRKLRLGRTATPVFALLRAARRLRGTRLDLFGYSAMRRTERELVSEYRELAAQGLAHVDAGNLAEVIALLRLPEAIRGYEQLKLARVGEFRAASAEALRRIATG